MYVSLPAGRVPGRDSKEREADSPGCPVRTARLREALGLLEMPPSVEAQGRTQLRERRHGCLTTGRSRHRPPPLLQFPLSAMSCCSLPCPSQLVCICTNSPTLPTISVSYLSGPLTPIPGMSVPHTVGSMSGLHLLLSKYLYLWSLWTPAFPLHGVLRGT